MRTALVFAAAAAAACGPELVREAGALELTVTGVPAGADAVRVEVEGPEVEPYSAVLGVDGPSLTHRIASVPARDVQVVAAATRAGRVERWSEVTVRIVPDMLNTVALDLSGAAPLLVSSPPIVWTAASTLSPGETVFEVTVPITGPDWTAFVDDARTTLGRDPTAFELRAARVAGSSGDEGAQELDAGWEDEVTLFLSGPGERSPIEVGHVGDVEGSGPRVFVTSAGATDLGALHDDLLAGRAVARLSGPAEDDQDEGSISVQVDLTLEWAAR